MRTRNSTDLRIHIAGLDLEVIRYRCKVADVGQHLPVAFHRSAGTGMLSMPVVHLPLQLVAGLQQRFVCGFEVLHDVSQRRPELGVVYSGARRQFVSHKLEQCGFDFQTG